MEKNNKVLYVVIVVLLLCVLLLAGYIIYDKKANNNKGTTPTNTDTQIPEEPAPQEPPEDEEEPAALSIIKRAEEILSSFELYNTHVEIYTDKENGFFKGNLNDVPNQAKLQFLWLHFKNEFEEITSDKMLKYAKSIFGKDYTVKFEDIKDFYATGIYNDNNTTKLAHKYNKNTKKYDEYCNSPDVCGGHGVLYPLGELIKYELVDSKVEDNKYMLTYKQLFYDPSGFMHSVDTNLSYSITDINGKELINKKLGFILGNKAKELDETEIIDKESQLLPLSISKDFEKVKNKIPNITYTFEMEDGNLILKSINY